MLISITNYQFSHGKKPSGFGVWAFSNNNKTIVTKYMSYSDAKKIAKKELDGNIFVCP